MRKLSFREKQVLSVGSPIVVLVLVFFYLVQPFTEAQVDIATQLDVKADLLQRSIQLIQQKSLYLERLDTLDRALLDHRGMLLDSPNSSKATSELELTIRNLASEQGVTIARSNPLQERKLGERYSKITLQLNLQASMDQLVNFVYALSNYPKFLLVEDFYLSGLRVKKQIRLQPRMQVSGLIRLYSK